MIKTIWKFEMEVTDIQEIALPIGAEILSVQAQREQPCLWVLVDPEAEKELRTFETFGTGHHVFYDMGVERKHIGTYQLKDGALVFHVFESL